MEGCQSRSIGSGTDKSGKSKIDQTTVADLKIIHDPPDAEHQSRNKNSGDEPIVFLYPGDGDQKGQNQNHLDVAGGIHSFPGTSKKTHGRSPAGAKSPAGLKTSTAMTMEKTITFCQPPARKNMA